MLRRPADGVRALGIDPAGVDQIILTHLHYDHAGSLGDFPRARFHAQDAEIAYAEGVDVVRYLVRKREHFRFQGLVERVRAGEDFASAMKDAYGVDMPLLEQEWREDVARRYTFWPVLLSGTFVWIGVLGLFVLGWRKKRKRAKLVLSRWAEEEAREDAVRAELEARPRVHIVLSRGTPPGLPPMPPPESEVPKVQHEGQWHTLH